MPGNGDPYEQIPEPFNHTDPVQDDEFPNIVAYDPELDEPTWPRTWSARPTPRDQYSIEGD